jgi:hypothetical protein
MMSDQGPYTFTGSLPFLYQFSFLTADVLADGHHPEMMNDE